MGTVFSSCQSSKDEDLPVLRGDEARSIDLNVTEALGRVRVLECVATRIADTIEYHLPINKDSSHLLFVAGNGNNGANAIASARILGMRGWRGRISLVTLFDPISDDSLRPNIVEQLNLYKKFVGCTTVDPMGIESIWRHDDVIIDGVLGTGIDKPPRGAAKEAIEAMSKKQEIVSIDVPSGMNHITGSPPGECVMAKWTINLHMLKSGQLEDIAAPYIGELWSVESALGFVTFPDNLADRFRDFYKAGPIRRV